MAKYSFIEKIHQLSQIKPSQEWVADLRQKLLIEKKTQGLMREDFDFSAGKVLSLFSFLKNFPQPTLVLRPVIAFLLLVGFLGFGLGGLALASQKSLPGEGLYIVKTAFEQARLALTKDIEARAKIQAEFTEKRINELNQIILQSIPIEKKTEKTGLAVTQLTQHLISLKDQLPKVESQLNSAKALAIAETLIEKTEKVEKVLNSTREKGKEEGLLREPQVAKKIAELSLVADKAETQALGLIVGQKVQGVSDEELTKKVADNIEQAEQKIKAVDEGLADKNIIKKLSDRTIVFKEQSARAKEILNIAKEALDKQDLAQAVETTKVAKEVFSNAQETIEVLAIVVESEKAAQETESGTKEATTTPVRVPENQTTTPSTQEPAPELKIQFLQLSTF